MFDELDIAQMVNETLGNRCPDMLVYVKYSDKMYKALGQCSCSESIVRKVAKITISRPFLKSCQETGNIEELKDTVLHEIGHAITYYEYGKGHGHDHVWKKVMRSIGGNPERLASAKFFNPYRYVYKCPVCGKESKTLRKYQKDISCGKCCMKYNNGKYSDKYRLKLVEDKGRITQC